MIRKRHLMITASLVALFLVTCGSSTSLRGIFTPVGRVVLGVFNINSHDYARDYFTVRNPEVERFLELYSKDGRSYFKSALARSTRYVGEIKRIFRQYGIPADLAYLALIESGFKNNALSRVYATGMWQFMYGTGLLYGLRIDREVDERRDFYRASHAAAQFLKNLHRDFGDWYLALAAYNAGPGYIKRKMQETGAIDFWTLARKGNLYPETRDYVPRFVAARMIAMQPDNYGFSGMFYEPALHVNRITIKSGSSLSELAQAFHVPLERLRKLNPHLLRDRVPAADNGYTINFPHGVDVNRDQAYTLAPKSRREG